jgi:hypothetical protein
MKNRRIIVNDCGSLHRVRAVAFVAPQRCLRLSMRRALRCTVSSRAAMAFGSPG